jgi:hypothetical protein
MEGMDLIGENWLTVLNAAGIIGGLFFTAVNFHSDAETRRVANLFAATASHRDVWKEFFRRPELKRVLDPSPDLKNQDVTPKEAVFVNMVILHTSSVFEALKDRLVAKQQGLRKDVAAFFSLPIPSAVWEKSKLLQNSDFVAFVEECRKGGHTR